MGQDTFFKDSSMDFVECRYSTSSARQFKEHMHKTFSVGVVDRGEVVYTVDRKESRLQPGSLALINPESMHSCNTVGTKDRSYYMLYLDVDWCLRLQKTLWAVETFVPVATIRIDSSRLYEQYIQVMKTLMDTKYDLLEKEQLLLELMAAIFQKACPENEKALTTPANVESLRLELGENLRENISLESLAEQTGANPYTLLRQFRKATGLTPHAYRMNCRIDLARKLLQQGVEIAETAYECGFFDQSHFHRHFKAMTTVTPQQYRVNFIQ